MLAVAVVVIVGGVIIVFFSLHIELAIFVIII